jgi:uncharacterized protein YdeI (YjbR/CyaY-like superfamily)
VINARDLELELLEVEDAAEWRSWLRNNHLTKKGIWLVFRRKASNTNSISYGGAIDEALAYGWIDSMIRRIDSEKYARKFTPRNPRSIWSKLNLDRVEKLKAEGRMTRWGLEAYAKRTKEISLLERFGIEGVEIPKDLLYALKADRKAWDNFQKFKPSYRKRYMIWVSGAKRPETKKKRIAEAVDLISQNVKDLLK